jgi:hypothetical protein
MLRPIPQPIVEYLSYFQKKLVTYYPGSFVVAWIFIEKVLETGLETNWGEHVATNKARTSSPFETTICLNRNLTNQIFIY